ncbi:GntR family transcriptional regulator [Actinokineospora sp. G85]|uniref:GntR family transcriptional regulator n=1 Tax=Actinokineospora sp. G85 TaxID=3406626 RepID=UPI003C74711E
MPEPLRDQVYLRLREEVLAARWSPADRFTEPKLARALGVSRTPVREALARLIADGLVRRHDYGYSVVVPDLATVRDLHEVRLAVELRGITRAIEDPDLGHDRSALDAELLRWRALRAAPPPPGPDFALEDERFHTALLAATGNTELVGTLTSLNRRTRPIHLYSFPDPAAVAAATADHVEILEHLSSGDMVSAVRLLRAHLGPTLAATAERAARALAARLTMR